MSKVNLPFDVHPCDIREDFGISEPPEEFVQHFALKKANSVGTRFPNRIVIGADTVVVICGKILGKPKNESEAEKILRELSGKTHAVFTGIALVKRDTNSTLSFSEKTDVTFVPLDSAMIHYYVTNFKPFDKAGAYGIQDWSACFVESIRGCYYNVMGFPLARFVSVLRSERFKEEFGMDNWLGKVED